MRSTTSVRLADQLSEGPSTVSDQSFARISADISERLGIGCWVIVGALTYILFHLDWPKIFNNSPRVAPAAIPPLNVVDGEACAQAIFLTGPTEFALPDFRDQTRPAP